MATADDADDDQHIAMSQRSPLGFQKQQYGKQEGGDNNMDPAAAAQNLRRRHFRSYLWEVSRLVLALRRRQGSLQPRQDLPGGRSKWQRGEERRVLLGPRDVVRLLLLLAAHPLGGGGGGGGLPACLFLTSWGVGSRPGSPSVPPSPSALLLMATGRTASAKSACRGQRGGFKEGNGGEGSIGRAAGARGGRRGAFIHYCSHLQDAAKEGLGGG